MASDLEARTIGAVAWRFIPFLVVCYFVAYLDRVNVGFAKLTMDADLGLTDTLFGFGAGVFFFAYFLFEVPSNMILDKVGARIWIARIMFSWGIVSGAMAFIPDIARLTGLSEEHTFYGLRILLGFAEAGFFPGIIFFLTLWFPASYRARIVGYFMAAIPLSSALGSPVSAALLGLDGAGGLKGWQWLFIAEALPSLVLAVVTFVYLTDRPADARWLADDQRLWLQRRLAAEDARREHVSPGAARSRASGSARAGAVARLFRRRRLRLRRKFLATDHRQGLRPFDRDDRLGRRHSLRHWLFRHGLVGPALGREGRANAPSCGGARPDRDRHRRLGLSGRSPCSR